MAHLVFICQTVDEEDAVLATTVSWIRSLAQNNAIDTLSVIALRSGRFDLPENVTVHKIQRNRNHLKTIWNFYAVLRKLAKPISAYLVHMGGPYPLLLWPRKIITGTPIYQWKTHPHINLGMWLAAKLSITKIFTATEHSFPQQLGRVEVLGHGIDVDLFTPTGAQRSKALITTGRISKRKRIDVLLHMLSELDSSTTLSIFGPTLKREDVQYQSELEELTSRLQLGNRVSFEGAVSHAQLPDILGNHKIFVSCSGTALDKAILEAMACECMILTTNPCVKDILPIELIDRCYVSENDPQLLAQKAQTLLNLPDEEKKKMGSQLRSIVVNHHAVSHLADRLVTAMHLS